MRSGARVAVVTPALDEEEAIGAVLGAIPQWVDQVMVIDNGSTDATAQRARDGGATVVTEPRRGYGSACLAGVRALAPTDVIVFLDADMSDPPQMMDQLVDPIVAGEADLVLAAREPVPGPRPALTRAQRLGNRVACTLIRWRWGVGYRDLGPFRAIGATAFERLDMRGHRLRLDGRDADRGGPTATADPRGRLALPGAHRPLEDLGHGVRHPAREREDPVSHRDPGSRDALTTPDPRGTAS